MISNISEHGSKRTTLEYLSQLSSCSRTSLSTSTSHAAIPDAALGTGNAKSSKSTDRDSSNAKSSISNPIGSGVAGRFLLTAKIDGPSS